MRGVCGERHKRRGIAARLCTFRFVTHPLNSPLKMYVLFLFSLYVSFLRI